MAQKNAKITGYVKLQIPAGKATPAPLSAPALGQHGVNIAAFTKEFNKAHQERRRPDHPRCDHRLCRPVLHLHHQVSSAAVLIKKAAGIESGSGVPNKTKVATISQEDVRKIAEPR